jgi:ribosomal-protein-alanine N-acetyltransferase
MDLVIDFIKEEDIDDILDISSLSFAISWSKDSYIQELTNPIARYLVVKIDNKTVGFIGTWIILDEAHITNIAIHPNYRKQGIASELLTKFLNYCKGQGCRAFTLEVRSGNKAAQALYKKYNFKEAGIRKGYYEDNKEDAIIMWLKDE